ncbi:MAG TPA: Wadjet anti-phage system protein JetD domain-containing protein, partial [Methylococcaceae bacterium]|nr:Wadjet anti-phage system protein JetD domain-containing protein [Methylococcaceae bacterium]
RQGDGRHYRLVLREVRHRVLGVNLVPDEVWIDSLDDALALIGKSREARRFTELVELTAARQPALLPWLAKRPLNALELANDWPLLLEVVAWLLAHPRPGIYLRQVDIPGVHSKFIEGRRGALAELLDLALPAEAIDFAASGASRFCRRYSFRDKPLRIRLRMLDPRLALLPTDTAQDVALDQDTFNALDPSARRVFITENEVNFLAFPNVADSLVIFGAGYGFDVLAQTPWLHRKEIHYWGDIDTHGFAILNELRAYFPAVESLLMDRGTLLAHEAHWAEETQPLRRDLPRLSREEAALYDDLRDNRIRPALRLEQERIGFGWLEAALAKL